MAETIPAGIEINKAKSMADAASLRLTGNRSAIIRVTGRFNRMDLPRFPRTAFLTQIKY